MDARDAGEFARAVRILRRAEKLLRATLADFERRREAGRGPGRQEQAVANQLLHILGTIGGVHRRNSNYKAAVAAYDAGYDFEKADAGYGIVNSYNLVQRLVARVLHAPTADLIDELEQAREALESQIAGPRRHDEYAAADLMTVLLLLGHEEWDASLDDFLDMRPERYAVDATLSMLQELHTRVTAARRAPARLAERLTEAIETLTAF